MLLNLSDCKTLLGISGTDYDTLLGMLLPVVQNDVLTITNNSFLAGQTARAINTSYRQSNVFGNASYIYNEVASATFSNSAGTLVDADSGFLDAYFPEATIDVKIEDTLYNDGYYGVETATASTLTLETGWEFIDEEAENIIVYLMKFPKSLQVTAAKMVDYHLNDKSGAYSKLQLNNEKSESLGDHSITYQDISSQNIGLISYPQSIQAELNLYRQLKFP